MTGVIYDAGFKSSSRFYEGANGVLGMTPTEFRSGGTSAEIYFAIGECSMGNILAAQTERGFVRPQMFVKLVYQDVETKSPSSQKSRTESPGFFLSTRETLREIQEQETGCLESQNPGNCLYAQDH